MRRAFILFFLLAACEESPQGPAQVKEEMHLETREIRLAVDDFKNDPTPENERRVAQAFAAFDRELQVLEQESKTVKGEEWRAIQDQLADLRHRRAIHWARCHSTPEGEQPVPVAERVR